ncbi:tigger transposable element-derived protein 1 [Trichonephila clavipes]|nr:tigger transposable element-derived protein 1 [Trichonephila clavipes]
MEKKTHQRQSISLETKIAILDRLGKGEGPTAIGKHFNLDESTARAIKKNEASIRKLVISGTKLSIKFASYTRDVLLERTERAIAIWIEEQVQRRIPVSGYLIQEKALNETITGESATTDEGAAKIFPEELAKIIEDGDYSADQVFNADETGLYWKKLPNRTYIAKDEKTASGHKASKDRVSLLLCSNASGDRMLKPLLINKSLRPCALKDKIINLEHEIGGEGFNTFSHDDIDELLLGDALSDNDIIDLTLDLTVDGVVGLEGDNDEEKKSTPLTGKLIQEGLQLCSKLENHFLIDAPNSERASKLQRRATQNKNEVCENPWPLPQISIAETVSSDDEDGDRFKSCQVIYSQFGLAIHQNDHQTRRRFVEWDQNEIAVVPDFHKRILFSDEAHFWLNGYVNKQNCRIWSEANPQVYVETPLHPEKLTVWCALWAGGILQKR